MNDDLISRKTLLKESYKSISCDNLYAAEKVNEAIEIVKGNGEKK